MKTTMMQSNYVSLNELSAFILFFKENQNNLVCLFLWHQNLVYLSKYHQERYQSPALKATQATCPRQVPAGSVWLITRLTMVNGVNAPQLGSFKFCLRVFTCTFIKNCSPSRQPSPGFSMWATVLYYTWHLSIKEETLLKQTEVKLVLSSTSDLPLLLSSKGKFVLEQW